MFPCRDCHDQFNACYSLQQKQPLEKRENSPIGVQFVPERNPNVVVVVVVVHSQGPTKSSYSSGSTSLRNALDRLGSVTMRVFCTARCACSFSSSRLGTTILEDDDAVVVGAVARVVVDDKRVELVDNVGDA